MIQRSGARCDAVGPVGGSSLLVNGSHWPWRLDCHLSDIKPVPLKFAMHGLFQTYGYLLIAAQRHHPLTYSKLFHLVTRAFNLPRVVTQMRRDRELNPRLLDRKSNAQPVAPLRYPNCQAQVERNFLLQLLKSLSLCCRRRCENCPLLSA